MKTFLADILILAGILGVVACVMFLPPKTMCRLEKNKGVVLYDAPVTKAQATKVLDTLVETGVFNGLKAQTHLLKCVIEDGEKTIVWSMMTDPNYATVLSDYLLRGDVEQLHSMIFSNNQVLVEIADEVVAESDKTQQIQTDWGSVFYDPPIQKQAAQRLAQIITQMGGYRGTIHLLTEGQKTKYLVQRDPASLEFVRKSMAGEMQAIVLKALPEERVRMQLVGEDLQPLKQKNGDLMEPLLEPSDAQNKIEAGK